jgi:hypothetical protein
VSNLKLDSGFWSFLERGQTIRRCASTSPAHVDANASLARLTDRILRLRDTDPHGLVLDELHALLKSECFWMASETGRMPAPDSTRSLKEWWSAGGDSCHALVVAARGLALHRLPGAELGRRVGPATHT